MAVVTTFKSKAWTHDYETIFVFVYMVLWNPQFSPRISCQDSHVLKPGG